MELEDALWLAGAVAALGTLGYTLVRAFNDDARRDIDRLNERVGAVETAQHECQERYAALRDELHRDYAPSAKIDSLRQEIKEDFREVFSRLGNLGESMARYAGRADARRTRVGDDDA